MNELTREASKQTILEAISFLWLARSGKDRDSLLDTYRKRKDRTGYYSELQGTFQDYTTENPDVSSPCERLPDDYQAFLDGRPKYVQPGGIDTAAFREWCTTLDREEKWIMKTEKELF